MLLATLHPQEALLGQIQLCAFSQIVDFSSQKPKIWPVTKLGRARRLDRYVMSELSSAQRDEQRWLWSHKDFDEILDKTWTIMFLKIQMKSLGKLLLRGYNCSRNCGLVRVSIVMDKFLTHSWLSNRGVGQVIKWRGQNRSLQEGIAPNLNYFQKEIFLRFLQKAQSNFNNSLTRYPFFFLAKMMQSECVPGEVQSLEFVYLLIWANRNKFK